MLLIEPSVVDTVYIGENLDVEVVEFNKPEESKATAITWAAGRCTSIRNFPLGLKSLIIDNPEAVIGKGALIEQQLDTLIILRAKHVDISGLKVDPKQMVVVNCAETLVQPHQLSYSKGYLIKDYHLREWSETAC